MRELCEDEIDTQPIQIPDLQLSNERAEETKGGSTITLFPYGGFQGGVRVAAADVDR